MWIVTLSVVSNTLNLSPLLKMFPLWWLQLNWPKPLVLHTVLCCYLPLWGKYTVCSFLWWCFTSGCRGVWCGWKIVNAYMQIQVKLTYTCHMVALANWNIRVYNIQFYLNCVSLFNLFHIGSSYGQKCYRFLLRILHIEFLTSKKLIIYTKNQTELKTIKNSERIINDWRHKIINKLGLSCAKLRSSWA